MKEKIKKSKGFIQIPLSVIIIITLITVAGTIEIGAEYYETSKVLREAEELTKEEKYNEAIGELKSVQTLWLVRILGVKKQRIANEIEKNQKLLEDKLEYNQGIEEFNKENWERAKELLSRVSEISPYHQDAKSKIEEIQEKITEKQIAEAVKKAIKKEQAIEIPQKRVQDRKEDEQEIKELLWKSDKIYSKGFQNINNLDIKALYEMNTPNYRKTISFEDFSQNLTELTTAFCTVFEAGEPMMINVKEMMRYLYYNDPEFSDIRKEFSFQEIWEASQKEIGIKEKMTIQEWNDVNTEEAWFSEKEVSRLLMLCNAGKIETVQINIQIEEYSEGEWARVTYKVEINDQEIPELEMTEENPEIFRKVNGKWYWVEKDKNAPGFNEEDLPPPIRGIIKAQEEEISEELKKELEKLPSQPPPGFQVSELVKEVGRYVVGVACTNYDKTISSGSGIISALGNSVTNPTRENSIILTNYHITQNANLTLETPCIVGYSDDPTVGFTDFYLATPVYWPDIISETTMELIDFDFLSIEEKVMIPEYGELQIIPNASLILADGYAPFICSTSEIAVGKEIVVLGYPIIGGEFLTATEGIISGFDGIYYLTTSAKVEEGSSGGGAFLKSTGCLAGMSTFVRLGRIESFARLINMPYLYQNYLLKIWKY